ncbi:MAG: histidine kinase [Saprospiraceae bacterium]
MSQSIYREEISRQLVMVIIISILITLLTHYTGNGRFILSQLPEEYAFTGILTLGLWFGNGFLVNAIRIPWLEQPLKRLLISILLTFGITLMVAILAQTVYGWLCCKIPFSDVFKRWDWGYYGVVLVFTFFISTFMHGRQFFFQYRTSLLEAEQLKQENLESQYEILKNQVNPHFLFNSLNVLYSMVHKDPDGAAKFIKKLSDVYRYVLDSREKEVVLLSEEITALNAYLFLIRTRFGQSVICNMDLKVNAEQWIIPLSLQMLVENAIKHNAFTLNKPIQIAIFQEGEAVIVENSLNRKNEKIASSNLGLKNIQSRYAYLSDQKVDIIETDTLFRVSLPLLKTLT